MYTPYFLPLHDITHSIPNLKQLPAVITLQKRGWIVRYIHPKSSFRGGLSEPNFIPHLVTLKEKNFTLEAMAGVRVWRLRRTKVSFNSANSLSLFRATTCKPARILHRKRWKCAADIYSQSLLRRVREIILTPILGDYSNRLWANVLGRQLLSLTRPLPSLLRHNDQFLCLHSPCHPSAQCVLSLHNYLQEKWTGWYLFGIQLVRSYKLHIRSFKLSFVSVTHKVNRRCLNFRSGGVHKWGNPDLHTAPHSPLKCDWGGREKERDRLKGW